MGSTDTSKLPTPYRLLSGVECWGEVFMFSLCPCEFHMSSQFLLLTLNVRDQDKKFTLRKLLYVQACFNMVTVMF